MVAVSKEVETGTTTLGLVCKDGVVLAADRRATAGTLIAHKRTKKVYRLDDNLGLNRMPKPLSLHVGKALLKTVPADGLKSSFLNSAGRMLRLSFLTPF